MFHKVRYRYINIQYFSGLLETAYFINEEHSMTHLSNRIAIKSTEIKFKDGLVQTLRHFKPDKTRFII